jgi:serine/threonine-protein kinase PRP4
MEPEKPPDEPQSKREAVSDQPERLIDGSVEEPQDLFQLLDDNGNFCSAEDLQERIASERRRNRRKRLRGLQDNDNNDTLISQAADSTELREHNVGSVDAGTNQIPSMAEANPSHITTAFDSETRDDNDDDDEGDMFSSSVSPITTAAQPATLTLDQSRTALSSATRTNQPEQQQDWDDAEGYYKAVIGETIHLNLQQHATASNADSGSQSATTDSAITVRLRVDGVMGKGVFSTVLKCTVSSNPTSIALPRTLALKCIRHNETMAKAAVSTELTILWRLLGCPGIVPLLLPPPPPPTGSGTTASSMAAFTPLEHKGHVIFGFGFMEYNLRDVLLKFGKGVGLSLQAVRSYYGQLLAAATHLQKHGVIHADLKPDNILVSADFAVVQLADFGSALTVASTASSSSSIAPVLADAAPTPYLVSRFYRAPEIILGLAPSFAIDLWSLAVTVAEIYLGDVLFRGTTNNDMLFVMQQHLGAVSNRLIRQHLVAQRRFAVPPHFQPDSATGGNSYVFTQQTTDPVTGAPLYKIRSLVSTASSEASAKFPLGTPLAQRLKKAKSSKDSRKMIQHFTDLLTKCLALDPTRRIVLKEALRHEFFQTTSIASTT